jgi:hypothetical protein
MKMLEGQHFSAVELSAKSPSQTLNHRELSISRVAQGMDPKFHCSVVDQRKRATQREINDLRETLWWKICPEIARKSGRLMSCKLQIISHLT